MLVHIIYYFTNISLLRVVSLVTYRVDYANSQLFFYSQYLIDSIISYPKCKTKLKLKNIKPYPRN